MLQRFRNTLHAWRAPWIIAVTLFVGLVTGAGLFVVSLWEEEPVEHPIVIAIEAGAADGSIKVNSVEELDRLDNEGRLGDVTVLVSPEEWFLRKQPEESAVAGRMPADWSAKHTLLELLPKMPRLRVLIMGPVLGDSADKTMALIGELEYLDTLMLMDSSVESRHLKHLAGLEKLRFLDLSQCDLGGGLEPLSELPGLRVFGYRAPLASNALAADLLAVPQIETLLVDAKYEPGSIMDAGIKSLAAHPGLKEIVLEAPRKSRGDRLRNLLIDRLPHIAVRKLKTDDDELPMWCAVVSIMGMFLLLGIHTQLMKHLTMPLAGVIPRYVPKQLTFPFALVVAFCVVGIFVQILVDEVAPQLAHTLTALTAGSAWILFRPLHFAMLGGRLHFLTTMASMIGPFVVFMMVMWQRLNLVELTEVGGVSIVAVLSLVAAAWAFVDAWSCHSQTPRLAAEAGTDCSISFDSFASTEKLGHQRVARRRDENSRWWWLDWYSLTLRYQQWRLSKTLNQLRDSSPRRCWQLLRLGNPSPLPGFIIGIFVTIALVALVFLMQFGRSQVATFFTVEFLRALLPVLILFGVSFSVGPRIADWSGRLNSNETELLRPVSRRDVRNHLFTAIAFDKLLHFALGIGLYVFLAVGLGLRSLGVWLVADIVFLATASYFSATAMKWLVVQTRDGIFNVVRELTFLLLWPASFMPVILWPEHVPTLAASVTMHIALCIAAGWSALRHWETFEVA
jgi:hypothetical protein